MFKFITAASVLAVASASNIESPMVESEISHHQSHFPNKGWEISDWLVGLTMGTYGPLVTMARDEDCFSAWYTWGATCIEMSKYFDKQFETKEAM